jgi:hypothetical protein
MGGLAAFFTSWTGYMVIIILPEKKHTNKKHKKTAYLSHIELFLSNFSYIVVINHE